MSATSDRWDRAAEMARLDPEGITHPSDHEWGVRSAHGQGSYRVKFDAKANKWACTCEDFHDWDSPCKHIFRAYQSWMPNVRAPFEPQTPAEPKKRYTQNYRAYNLAQREEFRLVQVLSRGLADSALPGVPDGPRGRGRPPITAADQFYCAVLKVYSQKAGRRAEGELLYSDARTHLNRVPGYLVTSRFFNRSDVTPYLENLVTESARPLAPLDRGYAQDSTGIQTTSFGAWREAKHGEVRQRRWLKAHALVGVHTHAIARLSVTEKDASDYNEFAPAVQAIMDRGFVVEDLYGDKAYTGRSNYKFAEDRGIQLYTQFRTSDRGRPTAKGRDSLGRRVASQQWRKMYYWSQLHPEEFANEYHKRSNIEAAFSALKRKFGENLRSKNPVAQVNELYTLAIAYNLTVLVHEIFEHGVVPSFLADPAALEAER